MGNIKAFIRKKKKKPTPKESWYFFIMIILAVTLVVLLLIFLHNPFGTSKLDDIGQIVVGDEVSIETDTCGSYSQTMSFYGSMLGGYAFSQNVYFKALPNSENCKARAKVFMYSPLNKIENIEIITTNEWVKNNDGYYYYKGEFSPNMVVKFVSEMVLPNEQLMLKSSNNYDLIITVETLPTNSDFVTLWNL